MMPSFLAKLTTVHENWTSKRHIYVESQFSIIYSNSSFLLFFLFQNSVQWVITWFRIDRLTYIFSYVCTWFFIFVKSFYYAEDIPPSTLESVTSSSVEGNSVSEFPIKSTKISYLNLQTLNNSAVLVSLDNFLCTIQATCYDCCAKFRL